MPFQPVPTNDVSLDSELNRHTDGLAAAAAWTGEFVDVKDYAAISITARASHASANDGLVFQWSIDGVEVDFSEGTSLAAGVGRGFSISARARFFRVKYTNGPVAATYMRVGTVFHCAGSGLITRPLDKNLTDENFAQTVRAVLAAQKPDGTYMNLKCTVDGALIKP